jgi:hypothetical protein
MKLSPPPYALYGGEWPDANWGVVNAVGQVTINAVGVEFPDFGVDYSLDWIRN